MKTIPNNNVLVDREQYHSSLDAKEVAPIYLLLMTQTDKSELEAVLRSMTPDSNKRKQTTGLADGSTGRNIITKEIESENHR